MRTEAIRVLIAEDMEPIRKRYVKILSETTDIEVIADVESGKEAMELTLLKKPDIVLMDIEMETKDAGLWAAQELLIRIPDIKIIILTVYEEDELIYKAFQLGVCDYIMKNATAEEVVASIRNVYEEKASLRPELVSKILGEFKRVKTCETSFLYAVNVLSSLTGSEIELLKLILMRKTRKEICKIRYVEMSTVKTQIRNILQKFNKKSVEEVIQLVDSMNLHPFINQK